MIKADFTYFFCHPDGGRISQVFRKAYR